MFRIYRQVVEGSFWKKNAHIEIYSSDNNMCTVHHNCEILLLSTLIRLKLDLKCETLQSSHNGRIVKACESCWRQCGRQNNSMRLIIKFQVDYFTWFMVNCLIGKLKIYTYMLLLTLLTVCKYHTGGMLSFTVEIRLRAL